MKTKIISDKRRVKGLLERKLEDPNYRKRFEQGYAAFELEVQILNALEQKGWTFADLAKVMHTAKSNISRDLSGGGIHSATISRLVKMGKALGFKFLPLFVPEKKEKEVLPKIHKLVTA